MGVLNPVKFFSKDYYKQYPVDFINWKNTPEILLNKNNKIGPGGKKFSQPFDISLKFQVWVKADDPQGYELLVSLFVDKVKFTDSTDTDHFNITDITPVGAEIDDYIIYEVAIGTILIDDLKVANKIDCINLTVNDNYISNELYLNESSDLLRVEYSEEGFKQGMFFNSDYILLLDKFQLLSFEYPFEDEDVQTVKGESRLLKSFFSEKRSYQAQELPKFYTQKLSYILGCTNLSINGVDYISKSDVKQNYKSFNFDIQTNDFDIYERLLNNTDFRFPINNPLTFKQNKDDALFLDNRNTLFKNVSNDPGQNNKYSKLNNIVLHNELTFFAQVETTGVTPTGNLFDTQGNTYNGQLDIQEVDTVEGWTMYSIEVVISSLPIDKAYYIELNGLFKSECFEVQNLNIVKYPKIGLINYPTSNSGLKSDNPYFWIKNIQVIEDEYKKIDDEDYNDVDSQSNLLFSNPKELVTLKVTQIPSYLVLKLAMITTHEFTYNGQLLVRNGGFKIDHLGNGLNNLEFDCELVNFEEYEQIPPSNSCWILDDGIWSAPCYWTEDGIWNTI